MDIGLYNDQIPSRVVRALPGYSGPHPAIASRLFQPYRPLQWAAKKGFISSPGHPAPSPFRNSENRGSDTPRSCADEKISSHAPPGPQARIDLCLHSSFRKRRFSIAQTPNTPPGAVRGLSSSLYSPMLRFGGANNSLSRLPPEPCPTSGRDTLMSGKATMQNAFGRIAYYQATGRPRCLTALPSCFDWFHGCI